MTAKQLEKTYNRFRLLFAPSQTKTLVMLSLAVGLSTGLMAFLFERGLRFLRNLFMDGSPLGWVDMPFPQRLWLIGIPAIGGLLVGPLIVWLAPEAKGHGVPEVMYAVNKQGGRIRGRVAFIKALASALTIGSGGSAGREGPIVQIGASIGSKIGQWWKLPPQYIKTMAAAGAAGGISAAFNAPLAGVFFAIEVILKQFTAQAFSIVVLSSVFAAFVARGLLGDTSYFFVPTYSMNRGIELVLYGILGVLAAFVAQFFIWFLYRFEDAFENLQIPSWLKPAFGGLLVGLIGVSFPHIMGTGHEVIEMILKNEIAFGLLGVLLLGKVAATSFSLSSGGSGGVFMPSLFIGAALGGLFGVAMGHIVPGIANPGAYALVGMAACFAAATHAPMTAILILFEMTYDYQIILPVMTATVIAVMVSSGLRVETVYTLKLKRRGVVLGPKLDTDALSQVPVEEAMTKRVRTIKQEFTLDRITRLLEQSPHTGFPVVNEFNDLVGLITYTELHQVLEDPDKRSQPIVAKDIMRKKPPTVTPQTLLQQAMSIMEDQHVDRLPVVDPDDPKRLIGIVTKGDVAVSLHKLLKANM